MITIQDVQIIANIAEKFGTSAGERYLAAISSYAARLTTTSPVVQLLDKIQERAETLKNEFVFPMNDEPGSTKSASIDDIKKTNQTCGVSFARDSDAISWIKSFRKITGWGLLESKRCYDALAKDQMLQF